VISDPRFQASSSVLCTNEAVTTESSTASLRPKLTSSDARFEVFPAVKIYFVVFWVVAQCSVVVSRLCALPPHHTAQQDRKPRILLVRTFNVQSSCRRVDSHLCLSFTRIGTSDGLFYKRWVISWLAEWLSAFEEGLCSMEFFFRSRNGLAIWGALLPGARHLTQLWNVALGNDGNIMRWNSKQTKFGECSLPFRSEFFVFPSPI
jgi:hypothetical protein